MDATQRASVCFHNCKRDSRLDVPSIFLSREVQQYHAAADTTLQSSTKRKFDESFQEEPPKMIQVKEESMLHDSQQMKEESQGKKGNK